MEQKIKRAKTTLYVILTIFTIIFLFLSYYFYLGDLKSRLVPQVNRAIIQVSKILPSLEENENTIREISDNLEKSRQLVYKNNQEARGSEEGSAGEDVEAVIDKTLSWMNRITSLHVGRNGHVMVVSKDDLSILAHPDKRCVGAKLRLFGDVSKIKIPNLEELEGTITEEDISDDYIFFIPVTILGRNADPENSASPLDQGIIGTAFLYKDTYILCGVTLRDVTSFVVFRCLISTLLFFCIGWILVRYIGFALEWHKEEVKVFTNKLLSYSVIGVVVLFLITWYYQTMTTMTSDLVTMNKHAQVAADTLNTYRKYRKELSGWLDKQYLEQCRLAAKLVLSKGKDNVSRKDLAQYAKDLGVEYIYVFDKDGKVLVTNSPYDHFVISEDPEAQSYAFRTLLDGTDYVIQEPQKDEASGANRQYIGVSIRDENDLADGFVQIAIDPAVREKLLGTIDIQSVLDVLVIGLPDYAIAINKSNMKIEATTGLGFVKAGVEELGVDPANIKSGYNGVATINGIKYYVGVSETEDLYLVPLCRNTDNLTAFFIALRIMLCSIVAYTLFYLVALPAYKSVVEEAGKEKEEKTKEDSETKELQPEAVKAQLPEDADDDEDFMSRISSVIEVQDKAGFESRWKRQAGIPKEKWTPELRTGILLYWILFILSAMVVLTEGSIAAFGTKAYEMEGFAFILAGNWGKGFNMFSFSFCIFLICVLYFYQEVVNQILYRLAKVSDLKHETILLLIRNALKYGCAILFLYLGLAQFGVDTKALWASAGVLSLIVGFAAKDLVSDIIAGLFMIFEGSIKIGDCVSIGSWYGEVSDIGIRTTKVTFFSDTKIISNSSIRDIVNGGGEVALDSLKIPIPNNRKLAEIEEILDKELPSIKDKVPGLVKAPKYGGVNGIDDFNTKIKISVFSDPGKRKKAVRLVQREIKLIFDKYGITFN